MKSLIFLSQNNKYILLCHFAPECFLIILISSNMLVQREPLTCSLVWIEKSLNHCSFYFIGAQQHFELDFVVRKQLIFLSCVAFVKRNERNPNSEAYLILLNTNIRWKNAPERCANFFFLSVISRWPYCSQYLVKMTSLRMLSHCIRISVIITGDSQGSPDL